MTPPAYKQVNIIIALSVQQVNIRTVALVLSSKLLVSDDPIVCNYDYVLCFTLYFYKKALYISYIFSFIVPIKSLYFFQHILGCLGLRSIFLGGGTI